MFTNADWLKFLCLVLAAAVLYSYLEEWLASRGRARREQALLRTNAVRAAIANGGFGEFEDHELLDQLWIDLEVMLAEVGELTNRAARLANARGFDVTPEVPKAAQHTIARVLELTKQQSDDEFLLSTALVLTLMLRHVVLLDEGRCCLSASRLYRRLVAAVGEVGSGARECNIAAEADPVAALCKAFSLLTDRIAALRSKLEASQSKSRRRNGSDR